MAHPDNKPTAHFASPSHTKWRVTSAQKEALLAAFQEDAYPDLSRKNALAAQLGVTSTQISKWFQHRRESLSRLGQFKAQYNRTRRTPEELDVLQAAFDVDRYPSPEKLAQLEAQLSGVTAKQIKLWFKHRRKQIQKRSRTTPPTPTPPSPPRVDFAPPYITPPQSYYYNYKPPPFSDAELMALRGAHAVAAGLPSADALARLAALLNRPTPVLSDWFRLAPPPAAPDVTLNTPVEPPSQQQPHAYMPPTLPGSLPHPTNYTASTAALSHIHSDGAPSPTTPPLSATYDQAQKMLPSAADDAAKVEPAVHKHQHDPFQQPDVMQHVAPSSSAYPYVYQTTVVPSMPPIPFSATNNPAAAQAAQPGHATHAPGAPSAAAAVAAAALGAATTSGGATGSSPGATIGATGNGAAAAGTQAACSSAPTLAPLRYMHGSGTGQTYPSTSSMWYGTQSYSKS